MATYDTARQILAEIDRVLSRVDDAQVGALCDEVLTARHIVVHGLGREGLVMRGFAMRLMHLGLPSAVVGDMTAPPVGSGDLFLACNGPGQLDTVRALMEIARGSGCRVALVTAQSQAPLARAADLLVVLPAQTMAEAEGSSSFQAMGSAFEQALWILLDAMVPRLQAGLGQSAGDLRRRHTNLE
jgi:6-phospho-3-hexuloisomerase